MPDSIFRLEQRGDRIAVITKDWMNLADYRSQNTLTNEHPDLYTQTVDKDTIRVGTAAHPTDKDTFHIHGSNGIYAEVPLTERGLTETEIEWCEDTFMYGGDNLPETVIEFEIPVPEDLRRAIHSQDLDAYPELTTRNPDHDARHDILTTLQEHIEEERFRKTKLDSLKGYPIELAPEWDPENSHNDDRGADHLNDMAGMRSDSHIRDFRTVAGFDYYTFFYARVNHRGIHESKLEPWDLIALDVVGADDWTYCTICGGVRPEEDFLHVSPRHDESRTRRVCGDCADQNYANLFDDEAVQEARDDRAQRNGGQRRLSGDYSN